MNGNLRFGALLRRSGILRRSAKSNGRVADKNEAAARRTLRVSARGALSTLREE